MRSTHNDWLTFGDLLISLGGVERHYSVIFLSVGNQASTVVMPSIYMYIRMELELCLDMQSYMNKKSNRNSTLTCRISICWDLQWRRCYCLCKCTVLSSSNKNGCFWLHILEFSIPWQCNIKHIYFKGSFT